MTCPVVGDSPSKEGVIPHKLAGVKSSEGSRDALLEGLVAHQVVGGVMAYQADDG